MCHKNARHISRNHMVEGEQKVNTFLQRSAKTLFQIRARSCIIGAIISRLELDYDNCSANKVTPYLYTTSQRKHDIMY